MSVEFTFIGCNERDERQMTIELDMLIHYKLENIGGNVDYSKVLWQYNGSALEYKDCCPETTLFEFYYLQPASTIKVVFGKRVLLKFYLDKQLYTEQFCSSLEDFKKVIADNIPIEYEVTHTGNCIDNEWLFEYCEDKMYVEFNLERVGQVQGDYYHGYEF